MAHVVIFLGAPGAGKGTQAALLAAATSFPHVSTGDLFRENLAQETALGRRAKEFMESGRLVPDEVVIDMLFDRVAKPDCRDGYLLDGFPRTLAQADALDGRLDDTPLLVLDFVVRDEALVERLTGRLQCRSCGHIHHRVFSPPRAEGVCDRCSGELYQRADDAPEVVTERLRVYHDQTAPLIKFYEDRGVLRHIDAEGSREEIAERVDEIFRGWREVA